mgnify:CR=1 FL=1
MLELIQVNTPEHSCAVDITDLVSGKVRAIGVESGICVLYVPHTTAGISVNEGADPAVMEDVLGTLGKLVPWRGAYRHMEGNSAAHLKAILVGGSVQIIIEKGMLLLGTWERIFLLEFDGPRTRKIRLKVLCDR